MELEHEDLDKDALHDSSVRKVSNDGSISSTHTATPSEIWYDDQDCVFYSNYLDKGERMSSSNVFEDLVPSFALKESELKVKEIDLYSDLIALENEEKKTIKNHEVEIENLKKELDRIREADSMKSTRISELCEENSNLKKNICSLYKTAKSEIEHKGNLLSEANEKLDNLLLRKNIQNFRSEKCVRLDSQDQRKQSDLESSHNKSVYDERTSKRKRFDNSPIKFQDKAYEPAEKNTKLSNTPETTPQSHSSKVKEKALQKIESPIALVQQTPETITDSSLLRDATETNNLFFDLLPEPLKKSFYEYEQSQIISLNKLKQSFVNQYFNSDSIIQSPSVECTPKRAKAPTQHMLFNKSLPNTPSVSSVTLLTPSSNNRNNLSNNISVQTSSESGNSTKPSAEVNSNKFSRRSRRSQTSVYINNKKRKDFR